MQRLLLAWLACLPPYATMAAEAKPSTPEMKEKLHGIIRGQLAAFRKDDYAAAYKFAAPAFREQFPLAAFESMVRTTYAAIAKNTDATFGLTLDDGEKAVVNVRVVGAKDESVSYQYLLQKDGDQWYIGGVYILKDEGKTL